MQLRSRRPFALLVAAGTAIASLVLIGSHPAEADIRSADVPDEIITVGPGSSGRQTGAYNPDRDEYLHLSIDVGKISAAILRSDGTIRVPAFTVVDASFGQDAVNRNGNLDAEYNPSTKEYVISYGRRAPRGAITSTGRIFAHRVDAVSGSLGPAVVVDRVVSNDFRCWAENHDIVYDPATGGYVLAYAVALLVASFDPCEDSSGDHKTTVARLSADLVPGPRTDLPGDLPAATLWTQIERHPSTGQFLVGRLSTPGGRFTLLTPGFDVVREQVTDVANATPSSFPTYVFVGVDPDTGNWVAVTRGSQRSQIMVLAANGTIVTPSEAKSTQVHESIAVFPGGQIVTSEGFFLGEYDLDGERVGEIRNATGPDGDLFAARGIVPGANGQAMVTGNFAGGSNDDAAAWFIEVDDGADVESLAPRRFFESRPGEPTFDNQGRLGRRVRAGETVRVQITGRGGIPAGTAGVVANVTSIAPSGEGFVTVWDCTGNPPNASSLNFVPGSTVPNELIAKLSASGQLCLFASGAVDLIVDIVGLVD